jgi:hypothetical protein
VRYKASLTITHKRIDENVHRVGHELTEYENVTRRFAHRCILAVGLFCDRRCTTRGFRRFESQFSDIILALA